MCWAFRTSTFSAGTVRHGWYAEVILCKECCDNIEDLNEELVTVRQGGHPEGVPGQCQGMDLEELRPQAHHQVCAHADRCLREKNIDQTCTSSAFIMCVSWIPFTSMSCAASPLRVQGRGTCTCIGWLGGQWALSPHGMARTCAVSCVGPYTVAALMLYLGVVLVDAGHTATALHISQQAKPRHLLLRLRKKERRDTPQCYLCVK